MHSYMAIYIRIMMLFRYFDICLDMLGAISTFHISTIFLNGANTIIHLHQNLVLGLSTQSSNDKFQPSY